MNSHVLREMAFLDEPSSAVVTVVAVLPCVELHVLLQTVLGGELFATHPAVNVTTRLR